MVLLTSQQLLLERRSRKKVHHPREKLSSLEILENA